VLFAAQGLYGQTAPTVAFEAASLKPAQQQGISTIHPAPGGERFLATGITLKYMIQSAYRVVADQVVGGPDWMNQNQFDLEAKAERPSTRAELLDMLQSLLAERFQLRFHMEPRELPIYLLSAENPKIAAHEPGDAGDPLMQVYVDAPLHIRAEGTGASMDYLARMLRPYADRPIVEQTGLQGGYDFHLAFTMTPPASMKEGMAHGGKIIDFSGLTLAQALRQQMGLRLEPGKAPVKVMVIENAEKPTAN
jgi:uncharacterized protein (TIGR03435 family)